MTAERPALTPNRAFIAARKASGMGRGALAARVRECGYELFPKRQPPSQDSVVKCIVRIERGEVQRPGGDFYAPSLAKALGVPEAELFGEQQSSSPSADAGFTVTSHQIVPVFVGAHVAEQLMKDPAFEVTRWE